MQQSHRKGGFVVLFEGIGGNFPAFALQGSVAFTGRHEAVHVDNSRSSPAPRASADSIPRAGVSPKKKRPPRGWPFLFCLVEPAGIEPASANPPLPVLRV